MRYLLAMLLLAGFVYADDIKIETSIPKESPLSVVLVAQCGNAVGIYATMKDGRLLAFDMSTPVPFQDQIEWAKTAKRSVTVEAKCEVTADDVGASAHL